MSNINVMRKNLGPVTAYKYAVSKGFTGTEEEFAELMASYASIAQDVSAESRVAEGYALGKQNGVDVGNQSPYYHENAKYYAEQAAQSAQNLTIDDTLSEPGKAAAAKAVGDNIAAITDILGNGILKAYQEGKYIDISGSSVSMSGGAPVISGTSATYSVMVVPCLPGDVFVVTGTGGSNARQWAFISSSGAVLSHAVANVTTQEVEIVAPENSAFVIIHDKTTDLHKVYTGQLIKARVDNLEQTAIAFKTLDEDLTVRIRLSWEPGFINGDNGVNSDTRTNLEQRCRTPNFVPYNPDYIPMIESGYRFTFRAYSSDKTSDFVWSDPDWENYTNVDRSRNLKFYFDRNNASDENVNYIKFCIRKDDNTNLDSAYLAGKKFVLERTVDAQAATNIDADERIETFNDNLGNVSIRCAKEQSFVDGTPPKIQWYLLEEPGTGVFYYSKDLQKKQYLFTFPYKTYEYSFGILQNGDIIAVLDADSITTDNKSDDNRKNPYVYLASENWSVCHEVDFGTNLKPCGWLSNCGFKVLADGSAIFCEYTRQTTYTSNVWKLSGDPTNSANWIMTKQFIITSTDNQTRFKHCHMVMQDFYTGICYLSTGDDSEGAMLFYSTDNGANWTQLIPPNSTSGSEMYCRMLTLCFTSDYIYWASDTTNPNLHYVFRCARDTNGILDFSTVVLLAHLSENDGTATYGVAFIPEFNALLLLDRTDVSSSSMPVKMLLLDSSEIVVIGTLYKNPSQSSNQHLGFRTRFSEWYPKDGKVHFGYGLEVPRYNDDVNHNRGFGNTGAPEKYGKKTINNLILRVFKNGDSYGFTLDTIYV